MNIYQKQVGVRLLAISVIAGLALCASLSVSRAQSDAQSNVRPRRAEETAQPSPTPPKKEEDVTLSSDDVVRVETNLTNIFFTAADKQKRFVSTLKKEDVRILEDGVPQPIFTFQPNSDLPLSLAVLIDCSGSEERTLPEEKAAARTFLESVLRPEKDEAAIVSFTGEVTLEQGLTGNVARLRRAIDNVRFVPPSGYMGGNVVLGGTPPISGSFGAFDQAGFVIQDRRVPDPQVPSVDRYIVSPDYFRALEIPLLRGRLFSEADATGTKHVAIISEMTARQFFPGENPLGKSIQLGARRDDRPWAEIIGIVGDVHQYGLDSPATPQAYLLFSQSPFNYAIVLFARSKVGSAALTRAIEEQIRAIDKNTLLFNPAFMSEVLSHSLVQRRFTMSLLAAFGALALLLAAVGIYGLMSYMVVERTGEIGVRMAFGAQTDDVLRLVSRDGIFQAGLGLLAGLLVSLVLTRVLLSQLFDVSALDPLTVATVLLLLVGVALAAGYIPARRAARVDPMVALRYE